MANRSVQLYLYADVPGIGWRYCRAVFGAKNNIKPHVLLRPDGTEELHPEAVYYLSYRSNGHKVWENLGNNPSCATRALEKKRACLAYVATGGTVLASENASARTNLGGAIAEWLEIIKEKFSGDSYGAKKLVLDEFLRSYGKKP